MNPLTNVKGITKLSETELKLGVEGKASWHSMYSHSAWIFVGGLNFDLTEGDIICVFSQYGEIGEINLVRDKETGKSKGYCFICYEDQKSTILAVDNLNGIKLVGRIIRVDHCGNYETPEQREKKRLEDKEKRDREKGQNRYRDRSRDRNRDRDRERERDNRKRDYDGKHKYERKSESEIKTERRSR
ncbi:RNA-binding motif protein, X-linked 2-like [Panonychus citri]|uniref:RNA-binding motif protein, X-linked 2-like n=1 Tax=Panonychus citri TaxID=50023 RepID=UPI002307AE14|nr:RNA-binding motif protein, X-linked 2-like [Panonychus citri]